MFIAEGPSLVRAALAAGAVEELWATEAWADQFDADVIASDRVARAVSETDHPQGVLAVCRQPRADLHAIWNAPEQVLVLDRVADPGNVGTIIRTAAAAGAAGLVLLAGSVDPFNGKAVRSSAGAIFHIPMVSDVASADLAALGGRTRIATTAADGTSLFAQPVAQNVAWLLGSEAHGLTPEVDALADTRVRIPMAPGIESLNVAVAAALCLYSVVAATDTPGGS